MEVNQVAASNDATAGGGGGGDNADDGIRKLFEDYQQEWGDGGGAVISYPVWIADRLVLAKETLRNVARLLRALDRRQMDVQPNGIVHDIIDPSLHARLVDQQELQELLEQRKQQDLDKYFRRDDEEEDEEESDEEDEEDARRNETHDEMLRRRGSFQWVPVVVKCLFNERTQERRARFQGSIPGLSERTPMLEHVYAGLEDIFSAMLPLLAKLELLSEGRKPNLGFWRQGKPRAEVQAPHAALQNGQLQVVIKVQEYVLPPQSTYTGRWHTEGCSENICAAGVYYMDVSEQTTGGSLSFRPPNTPDEGYFEALVEEEEEMQGAEEDGDEMEEGAQNGGEVERAEEEQEEEEEEEDRGPAFWSHYIKDVDVQTGTAVVFHNTVPHRFRTIRNDTDEHQRRLFVNFFIVDPSKPLQETTSSIAGPSLVRRALAKQGLKTKELQAQVLGFLSSHASGGMLNRKLLRDQARAAMSKDRPHWYTYMFGNSGDLIYHSDNRNKDYDAERVGNYEHSACPTSELGSGL